MTIGEAAVLGVVQGITEFLPISSSGHLVIGQAILGMREPTVFFDVALHVGTLFAVLLVLRAPIAAVCAEAIALVMTVSRGKKSLSSLLTTFRDSTIGHLCIGTIPVTIVGFTLRHRIEELFASPLCVGISFLITASFLFITRFAPIYPKRHFPSMTWRHALFVGLIQALALAPGISRSGSTISAALITGCERRQAGQFSFLLFIPAVIGALILEGSHVHPQQIPWGEVIVGMLSSFLAGIIALRILLSTVVRGSFYRFAFYCAAMGITTIVTVLGR